MNGEFVAAAAEEALGDAGVSGILGGERQRLPPPTVLDDELHGFGEDLLFHLRFASVSTAAVAAASRVVVLCGKDGRGFEDVIAAAADPCLGHGGGAAVVGC